MPYSTTETCSSLTFLSLNKDAPLSPLAVSWRFLAGGLPRTGWLFQCGSIDICSKMIADITCPLVHRTNLKELHNAGQLHNHFLNLIEGTGCFTPVIQNIEEHVTTFNTGTAQCVLNTRPINNKAKVKLTLSVSVNQSSLWPKCYILVYGTELLYRVRI